LERKAVSGITLTLLLIGMLTLAFNTQLVRAEPTTWIVDDDGPADFHTIQEAINAANPGDAIFVEKGTYNEGLLIAKSLNLIGENASSTFIVSPLSSAIVLFTVNDVSICNFSVTTAFHGIWMGNGLVSVYDAKNVSIVGNILNTSFVETAAIYLTNTINCTIAKNEISSSHRGISLYNSTLCTVSENNVSASTGIFMNGSTMNKICNNKILGYEYSVFLQYTNNITMRNNTMVSPSFSYQGFAVAGFSVEDYLHDIDSSNTINGKPVFYLVNKKDVTINEDAGYVAAVSCFNISVQSLKLERSSINFVNTTNSRIQDVTIDLVKLSSVSLFQSSYIEICNCTFYGHPIFMSNTGATLLESNNVKMCNCIIENSHFALSVYNSDYNLVQRCKLLSCEYGVILQNSNNNTFAQNELSNFWQSPIYIWQSTKNLFYHNNFTGKIHGPIANNFSNFWDDGYPSGGNYWSDYAGVDVKTGPNQDLPGSDGIGDMPYIIDANNRDRYPLINPYGAPPSPTYALTIITTTGGTTNPTPGTYTYTANSTIQVTAISNTNYRFDHWELDTVNVGSTNPYTVPMDKDHTVKAVFSSIPPPLSASINPLSASINVGQSVTFASSVSGGYTPYTFQWYLNGAPVSGATSNTWIFTPTTSGIYYIYLKVTDAKDNKTQSETARITVATVPVGGYSIQIKGQNTPNPLTLYLALIAVLATVFTAIRRKIPNKK